MKKYIFLSFTSYFLVTQLYAVQPAEKITEQIQHLQKENELVLKAWQKAKIKEKLLFNQATEGFEKKVTSPTGTKVLHAAKSIVSVPASAKKTAADLLKSKEFIANLNKATNEEIEKISSQNTSFNVIKNDHPTSSLVTSPLLTQNKTMSLLYTTQAERAHYQLLWQKIDAKIKSLTAQLATLKEIKPEIPSSTTPETTDTTPIQTTPQKLLNKKSL